MATCATVIGIGGVDPEIGRDGSVRLAAGVADGDLGQRQRPRGGDVDRTGMQHHGRGDVIECSGLEQQGFSAAGFLRGCADQRHGESEVVGHLGQRQRSAHRGRRDDVVAAGMSDLGQRVVLGADADDQRTAAEVRAKRGVQPAGRTGDLEAVLGDQCLRLGAAAVLCEREFRLGVNRVRQLDQIATASLDGVFDADRRGGGGHPRSISLRCKAHRDS